MLLLEQGCRNPSLASKLEKFWKTMRRVEKGIEPGEAHWRVTLAREISGIKEAMVVVSGKGSARSGKEFNLYFHAKIWDDGTTGALETSTPKTADQAPPPQPQPFIMALQEPNLSFLSLPPELRLKIYKHILISRDKNGMPYSGLLEAIHPRRQDGRVFTPTLLRTCRTVYDEASPILYSNNRFLISRPEADLEWLDRIGPANMKCLRKLEIRVNSQNYKDSWRRLLERLHRDAIGLGNVFVHWFATHDWNQLEPGDEALSPELAPFVKRENESKFRCEIPNCSKLFMTEHFWRNHVEKRHEEWLDSIKKNCLNISGVGKPSEFAREIVMMRGFQRLIIRRGIEYCWPADLGKELDLPLTKLLFDKTRTYRLVTEEPGS